MSDTKAEHVWQWVDNNGYRSMFIYRRRIKASEWSPNGKWERVKIVPIRRKGGCKNGPT